MDCIYYRSLVLRDFERGWCTWTLNLRSQTKPSKEKKDNFYPEKRFCFASFFIIKQWTSEYFFASPEFNGKPLKHFVTKMFKSFGSHEKGNGWSSEFKPQREKNPERRLRNIRLHFFSLGSLWKKSLNLKARSFFSKLPNVHKQQGPV